MRISDSFDVLVTDDVIVEISRGKVNTATSVFGVDWDGTVHFSVNAKALDDALRIFPADDLDRAARLTKLYCRFAMAWIGVLLVCGVVIGFASRSLWVRLALGW